MKLPKGWILIGDRMDYKLWCRHDYIWTVECAKRRSKRPYRWNLSNSKGVVITHAHTLKALFAEYLSMRLEGKL